MVKFLVVFLVLVVCAKAQDLGFTNQYNRLGLEIQRNNDAATFGINFARRQNFNEFGGHFRLGAQTPIMIFDEIDFFYVERNIGFGAHYEFINHVIVGLGVGLDFQALRYMDAEWDRWDDEIDWSRNVEFRVPSFVLSPRLGFEWQIGSDMKIQYRIIYTVSLGSVANRYLRDWGFRSNENIRFRSHTLGNDIKLYRSWLALNFGFSFLNVERVEYVERRFTEEQMRNSIGLRTNLGVSVLF